MKKLLKVITSVLPLLALLIFFPVGVHAADGQNMYRLYNPNSGEHFYTANTVERDSLTRSGWSYEGIGWVAPKSGQPVYRLYNGNAGDHHYTTSAGERDSLIRAGWKSEGIGWYSGGSVPLYRQYNPNAKSGTHNYTTNKGENDSLVRAGWRAEGIGWYGTGQGKTIAVQSGTILDLYQRAVNGNMPGTYTLYGYTGKVSKFHTEWYSSYQWGSLTATSKNVMAIFNDLKTKISSAVGYGPTEEEDGGEGYYWDYRGNKIYISCHESPLKVEIIFPNGTAG